MNENKCDNKCLTLVLGPQSAIKDHSQITVKTVIVNGLQC